MIIPDQWAVMLAEIDKLIAAAYARGLEDGRGECDLDHIDTSRPEA